MKGQHIRGLNGIKGLAILMVISYHLFPSVTSGGFLWVNSFFVLGGFFLARSMEKIREANRPHALRDYVFKTIQRLWWPLLVFVLIMLAYLLVLDRRELSYDRSDILSSLFSSIITSRLALVGPTLLRWPGLRLLPTSGIIRFMSSLS